MKDAGETSLKSDFIKTQIPEVEYRLKLCPAIKKETEVNVGLFLILKTAGRRIHADYTISIGSAYKNELSTTFENSAAGHGRNKICSRDDLFNPDKKFIVDGKMSIKLRGTLALCCAKRKATSEICTLADLLCERKDKDFVIAVGEEEIKVTFVFFIYLRTSLAFLGSQMDSGSSISCFQSDDDFEERGSPEESS